MHAEGWSSRDVVISRQAQAALKSAIIAHKSIKVAIAVART